MARLSKPDLERWIEDGIYLPTKTLRLFGDVDEQLAEQAISSLFILDQTKVEQPITILLNSDGGDVTQGWAIIDAIKQCQSSVTIHVIGAAESMAAFILQAADRRVISPNALLMLHVGEYGLSSNHPVNNRARIAYYEYDEDRLCQLLYDRMSEAGTLSSDVGLEQIKRMITFDQLFTAEQALAAGLVDEII